MSLLPLHARLRSREPLAEDIHRFVFDLDDDRETGPDGSNHRPGQFVMLSVPGAGEAPFSVCHAPGEEGLELCIKKVGCVTRALFALEPGAAVGLRGPYGNGFPLSSMLGRDVLLVAGGLGIVPLRSVWQSLLEGASDYGSITLVYGMGSTSDMLFAAELEAASASGLALRLAAERIEPDAPYPTTEGYASAILQSLELDPARCSVACCGPPAMYRSTADLLRQRGIYPQNTFFTFERRMECGVGQCGHCTIGYRYTCLDGPVFSAWEARGLREAWDRKIRSPAQAPGEQHG